MDTSRTIAAISTPPGSGGIAIVRISGADAIAIAESVWQGCRLSDAEPRTAHLGRTADGDGEMIDEAVAIVWRAPASFTGEDTVEFSVHGSPWIQREVVNLLIDRGASAAEAGEFSRRALLHGRMDLVQAEGLADLIAASSKASLRLASRQMTGRMSQEFATLRDALVALASLLELELDFSEEDVEFADRSRLLDLSRKTRVKASMLADTFRAGKALKEGVNVVIAGAPNAGKSTLLNALLRDDRAIVSDVAGTTRDTIEGLVEIEGILFRLTDTAGLHHTDDLIERQGIERTHKALHGADIILHIVDASDPKAHEDAQTFAEEYDTQEASLITLYNKIDLEETNAADESHPTKCILRISAKNEIGIAELESKLAATARAGHNPDSELMVTNARHYDELRKTSTALENFESSMSSGLPADLLAQDLREAIHHLNALTGAITTDTLLHSIFSRFCIGK